MTERRYLVADPGNPYAENIFEEDRLVCEGLQRRGVEWARVDWADPSIDWRSFGAAVFRTTWDYFDRFDEFAGWLDRVQELVPLVNPGELVRWNWDKHYLRDLDAAGVAIVDTEFVEQGSAVDLRARLVERGWSQAVIKPAVSGAARNTYRVGVDSVAAHQSMFEGLVQSEAMLLQPFMADIVDRGEVTIMVIDGRVTHGVLKRAKPGDFRVQDDHGGTVVHHELGADEVAFAEAAFAACPEPPTYGRVDVVRDSGGRLRLMELELIEPEMWFRFHPPAADALAAAVCRQVLQR